MRGGRRVDARRLDAGQVAPVEADAGRTQVVAHVGVELPTVGARIHATEGRAKGARPVDGPRVRLTGVGQVVVQVVEQHIDAHRARDLVQADGVERHRPIELHVIAGGLQHAEVHERNFGDLVGAGGGAAQRGLTRRRVERRRERRGVHVVAAGAGWIGGGDGLVVAGGVDHIGAFETDHVRDLDLVPIDRQLSPVKPGVGNRRLQHHASSPGVRGLRLQVGVADLVFPERAEVEAVGLPRLAVAEGRRAL